MTPSRVRRAWRPSAALLLPWCPAWAAASEAARAAPPAARAAIADQSGAAIPSGHLAVADWRMTVVFRYDADRCTDTDTPDAPARAFHDARGRVHLFATHDDNRVLIGADFDHLHHPCRIVFRGRHSAASAAQRGSS